MKLLVAFLLIALAVVTVSANSIIVENADITALMGYEDSVELDISSSPRIIVDGAEIIDEIDYAYSSNLTVELPPRIVLQQAGTNNRMLLIRPDMMLEEITDPRYRTYLPVVSN